MCIYTFFYFFFLTGTFKHPLSIYFMVLLKYDTRPCSVIVIISWDLKPLINLRLRGLNCRLTLVCFTVNFIKPIILTTVLPLERPKKSRRSVLFFQTTLSRFSTSPKIVIVRRKSFEPLILIFDYNENKRKTHLNGG